MLLGAAEWTGGILIYPLYDKLQFSLPLASLLSRSKTCVISCGANYCDAQVEIGNTYDGPALKDMYFYKLDLKDIIPVQVSNAQLINSIARSMGLHDFYQVGLWNFCEGFYDE